MTVDDPDAIVLVNEHYIATPETMTHLIPGPYRLMARKRKTNGRAYRATVEPGKTTAIRIAWGLDQVVKTDPSWTGLLFTSAKARERGLEGSVRQLAALLGAQTVIAVGISREKGRRSVIGMTFVMGERPGPARSASLAIEGREVSDDRLAQLGEYLAGTRDRPPTDPVTAAVQPSPESSPRAHSGLLWGGVVAGLGGIGAGIYFLRRDGELQCEDLGGGRRDCPTVQHTAALGYGLLAAGTAAAGLSSYFLWRSHRRSPKVAVQLGPVSGIAVAGEF